MCFTTYYYALHIVVHLHCKDSSLRDYHICTAVHGRTNATVVFKEFGSLLPDHHYL